MKVSQYLLQKLLNYGTTDIFGIPGSVVLDLIYEADMNTEIKLHLNYHEQTAAFAACGFAQESGKLGMAYSTKGPGFLNMMTAIIEAYCDSLPVIFITAHSKDKTNTFVRIEGEQEIDHIAVASRYVKFAHRIDDSNEAVKIIDLACQMAVSSRKGPVLLDFKSSVFNEDIKTINSDLKQSIVHDEILKYKKCAENIISSIKNSDRPIFLIGDGIRYCSNYNEIAKISEKLRIPVLSSRFSQDLLSLSKCYFGYIGSHGLRYSNFILSKTDCIVSLGNRLNVSPNSKSFGSILNNTKIIRVDVDENELKRKIGNTEDYCMDLEYLISVLSEVSVQYKLDSSWLNVCKEIKTKTKDVDVCDVSRWIAMIIEKSDDSSVIVCDIGNNELFSSMAYAQSGRNRKLLHSKTMKTVGCAIGKAIGAFYGNKNTVICIVGDQGFQFNIQELQYISSNKLPIMIVICNNRTSGMLKNSEKSKGYRYLLHTTKESGYSHPSFEKIAYAYGINYTCISCFKNNNYSILNNISYNTPNIIELLLDEEDEVLPVLPIGNLCNNFIPELPSELYNYIDNL